MVLLTVAVLVHLYRSRMSAVRQGLVGLAYFRIYQGEVEPESSAKAARQFANLFEAPVLFYVVCLAAMMVRVTGPAMRMLAWAYVAARVMHAIIHLGSNKLRWRVRCYVLSWLILLGMWLYLVAAVSFMTTAS